MASAVYASWEQRIGNANGRLLTGISLPGGWLRRWHRQVTVQFVQSNTTPLLKMLPWLLT